MKWNDQRELELEHDDLDLLVWNIPNEVMNGLNIDNFQERIGDSQEEFKRVSNRLRSLPETERAKLSTHEVKLFRNALALTLYELGIDEFSTRTGYDFDKGREILRELDEFLGGKHRLLRN